MVRSDSATEAFLDFVAMFTEVRKAPVHGHPEAPENLCLGEHLLPSVGVEVKLSRVVRVCFECRLGMTLRALVRQIIGVIAHIYLRFIVRFGHGPGRGRGLGIGLNLEIIVGVVDLDTAVGIRTIFKQGRLDAPVFALMILEDIIVVAVVLEKKLVR